MLKNQGESYVIIGHSERRALGETSELISQKVLSSLKAGLKVILCVGEKKRDHHGDYLSILKEQILSSVLPKTKSYIKNFYIAYEPVWAIGKSDKEVVDPANLHEMTIFIKKVLSEIYGVKSVMAVSVLYGGSVSYKNAKDLVELGEVQGLLVGHESLNPDRFAKLIDSLT
jgi:triosephosphate isomerase